MTPIGAVILITIALLPVLLPAAATAIVRAIGNRRRHQTI